MRPESCPPTWPHLCTRSAHTTTHSTSHALSYLCSLPGCAQPSRSSGAHNHTRYCVPCHARPLPHRVLCHTSHLFLAAPTALTLFGCPTHSLDARASTQVHSSHTHTHTHTCRGTATSPQCSHAPQVQVPHARMLASAAPTHQSRGRQATGLCGNAHSCCKARPRAANTCMRRFTVPAPYPRPTTRPAAWMHATHSSIQTQSKATVAGPMMAPTSDPLSWHKDSCSYKRHTHTDHLVDAHEFAPYMNNTRISTILYQPHCSLGARGFVSATSRGVPKVPKVHTCWLARMRTQMSPRSPRCTPAG